MDTQHPPEILSWGSPSTPAELFRVLRSFDEPKNIAAEQLNWDANQFDSNWPGFLDYLQQKNYDTSKVGIMDWEPVLDKNVILDCKAEDTEECKCFLGLLD